MENTYWQKQSSTSPLFPDVEWSKPQQRSKAGKLGIIGGNKLGLMAVSESYQTALSTAAGEVKILLPDSLKKALPKQMSDAVFAPSNKSGGLAKDAFNEMRALGEWADGILLIGDAGKNSETAVLYERFVAEYEGPLTITRDALDLLKNNYQSLVDRPQTLMIMSFAQAQKLFQAVYYPKVLTFSMQLNRLVEAMHKFTITYPICISVFHNDTLAIAHGGQVVTQPLDDPMPIWRGITATKAAVYWLWNREYPLQATAASLIET